MTAAVSVLLLGLVFQPSTGLAPSVSPAREPDELLLQQVGLSADADTLLTFARLRASSGLRPEEVRAAIDAILSGTEAQRAAAQLQLFGAGPGVLPYLRRAGREAEGPGREVVLALTLALEREGSSYTTAAIRLLVKRSLSEAKTVPAAPGAAAGALLGLITVAEDEVVLAELRAGLASLARSSESAASTLRKALEDPLALRRAVAIEAFALALPAEAGTTLRPFLNDPVPLVRLRAALTLAPTQEEAVGRLIALLAELPVDLAQEAEEYLLALAQEQAPKVSLGEKPEARGEVRDAWQKWWDGTTGPSLLQELRNRTLLEEDRQRATKLIGQLGDQDFEVREKATNDLKAMGARIRPLLIQAGNNTDLEVTQRLKTLLEGVAKDNVVPLPGGLTRLLVLRRPAGAVESLLAYLPFADETGLIEDIATALEQLAHVQPISRRFLVAALRDDAPLRKLVAAEVLGRLPDLDSLEPLRKCLDDRDGSVRLRVALALARQRERAAIPILLDLIPQLSSPEDDRLLEDYLIRLSDGLTRPTITEGSSETARKKRQTEWSEWWKENDARVALPRWDDETALEVVRNSGLTLVLLNGTGTVMAYDSEFRIRWQLNKVSSPFDAQVLPGDRVLVAEHDLRRVTERNLQGDVLWEKRLPGNPLQVERLPNGNTFIVCRDRLLEVTRSGREVLTVARPMSDLYGARKLRDGSIGCLSNQGRYFRVDARGKELSSFRIINGLGHLGNDLLPSGGALIPIAWQNKITEYDRDGKVVKEHPFAQPASVQRLNNGGMLLVNQQWPPRLIEIDRSGQVVHEATLPTNPVRAVRR
jgi:HEAT repeat protein